MEGTSNEAPRAAGETETIVGTGVLPADLKPCTGASGCLDDRARMKDDLCEVEPRAEAEATLVCKGPPEAPAQCENVSAAWRF
jgi:hypothetical protein